MKRQHMPLAIELSCVLLFVLAACNSTPATVNTTPTPTADIRVAATALAATSVASSATSAANSQITPTSTPTAASSTNSTTAGANSAGLSSSDAIKHFYQAIQAQNYVVAYTYVDANAKTTDGQTLMASTFAQLARNEDGMSGKLADFSLGAPLTDSTQIVMTLTRGRGLRYHAHLQMKKVGELWKIYSLDRI